VLTDFLRSDHKNLVNMLGPLLIDVGWSDMVKGAMFNSMMSVGHDSLQNPVIYDLAVGNALD
jgi:hypothetical protein